MRRLGIRGCRNAVCRGAPSLPRLARWTSCDVGSRPAAPTALDDRYHRAPDQGGQALLLRRAGCLLADGRRLVDRRLSDSALGDQRAGHGDQSQDTERGRDNSLRSRGAVRVLGVQPEGQRRRPRAVDGSRRCSVRQCDGRGVLGRMQVELLNRKRWKTRVELAAAIHDYIEIWHNTRRRHSALNMLTQRSARTNTNYDASPPDSRPPTPRNQG